MTVKIYTIEIIFKSHEPFQSYQLTGPAQPVFLAEMVNDPDPIFSQTVEKLL